MRRWPSPLAAARQRTPHQLLAALTKVAARSCHARDSCRIVEHAGLASGQPKGEGNAMKCGRGHDHASIADVRACYGVQASGQAKVRSNKYAGTCILCGCTVPASAGILFRSPGVGSQRLGQGEWLVQHMPGECEEAKLLQDIKAMQPRQVTAGSKANFKVIPQGYYATRKEHGIDFWFVRVPDDGGKWDGYRFVRRIVGGGGSPVSIRNPEQLAALHAILKAGVEAAGNLFADEMEQCKWCRKPLTRKASRELRCGSTCAGNRGLGEEWARLDALYEHQ